MEETLGATPEEVIPEVTGGEDAPMQMEETIRETLRELREKGVTIKDETPRDDQGKFSKPEPVEKVATEKPVTDEKAPIAPEPTDPHASAPNTWKKDVAEKWGVLPPEVRAEVARREADFHKGIEGYKQAAQQAQSYNQVLAPYAQTLQQLNVTPEVAISSLFAADAKLRNGTPQEKAHYISILARDYGIDLSAIQPAAEHADPNINALQQQIERLNGFVQNQQRTEQQRFQQDQQQREATLNSEIATFAADPKHSHFENVKGHMAALLQAGQANDLQSAYEQAVWANPATRTAALEQQAALQREEATQRAKAAKAAASVNTRTRPSMPVSQPIGTMDDTIRATLRRLQAA